MIINKSGSAKLVFLVAACLIDLSLVRGVRAVADNIVKETRAEDKIAADGKYLPFYGYSTNAPLVDWQKYSAIKEYIKNTKTLSKFISPLPPSSYHVTIFEIFSQRDVPEKYKPKSGTVPSVHWISVMKALKSKLTEAQKKCDLIKQDFQFRPERLRLGNTVLAVVGTLSNMGEISKLRQKLSDVFEKTEERFFHMSFGYFYNKKMSDKDKEEMNKEMEGLWKIANQTYMLHPPVVYYYETMEEFIPFMKAPLI